jgi:NTE family protein
VPRDMYDVMARQKDIQYSSRTRLITDMYKERHALRIRIRDLLARIPEADLSDEERKQKAALQHLPGIAILQLIYQQAAYEGQAKDYEFSGQSMREHWDTGYQDTKRTLNHKNWLVMPDAGKGIVMHDIHRLVS